MPDIAPDVLLALSVPVAIIVLVALRGSRRHVVERITWPSGPGILVAFVLLLVPFVWPLALFMILRYVTGHRFGADGSAREHAAITGVSAASLIASPSPGGAAVPASVAVATTTVGAKVCPDCAETVQAAARVCRFCRYEFGAPPEPVLLSAAPPPPAASVDAPFTPRPAGTLQTSRNMRVALAFAAMAAIGLAAFVVLDPGGYLRNACDEFGFRCVVDVNHVIVSVDGHPCPNNERISVRFATVPSQYNSIMPCGGTVLPGAGTKPVSLFFGGFTYVPDDRSSSER